MLQLLDTVIGHVAVLSTRHIANSLWALATLKEKRPDLVDKLCGAAMAKVMDFNSQEISNSLWALATFEALQERNRLDICELEREKDRRRLQHEEELEPPGLIPARIGCEALFNLSIILSSYIARF